MIYKKLLQKRRKKHPEHNHFVNFVQKTVRIRVNKKKIAFLIQETDQIACLNSIWNDFFNVINIRLRANS